MRLEKFDTARLFIHSWRPVIEDRKARLSLEANLSSILTRPVLEHLPPPLQLGDQSGGVSSWIDARAEESEVLLVESKFSDDLVGLMILAPDPDADKTPIMHIGYLLSEAVWGQGFGSELLDGLVSAVKEDRPLRLVAGVSRGNLASARVLQKAGFVVDPGVSTADTDIYVYFDN
ncbi:GNAT family N-acetyltransferase [Thioclava sp.]|uniref:GNAT family N-acetyltransferase n=1 Tax=Thioclava sp. TaxID=1933450 RepID=UPI003AA827A5